MYSTYRINIQRVLSNTTPEPCIELCIYNERTLDVMFRGQMTFPNFASAITGQQAIPITVLETRDLEKTGGEKI